jgi:hypothetical protein
VKVSAARILALLTLTGWAVGSLLLLNVPKLRTTYSRLWREHYELQQSGSGELSAAFEYKSEALQTYTLTLEGWLVFGLLPAVVGLVVLAFWPAQVVRSQPVYENTTSFGSHK